MNKMNITELRQKDVAALKEEILALQKAYFSVRMQKATQQITNTTVIRSARRSIARAKTILVQKKSI